MILKNPELNKYLSQTFKNEKEALLQALPESTAIRINTLKTDVDTPKEKFRKWGLEYEDLPFGKTGLLIPDDHLPLSQTLDHFLGHFQYQGPSSQLPPVILDPQPGEKVLDMAAAPGSKSTQIATMMKNSGQLYLNDINRHRIQALNTNLQKNGVMNQIILNLPGERLGTLFPNSFDRILLDAPCTALGSLHKNHEIDLWWSYNKLDRLCALQSRLLIAAFKALKTGGVLVYSTCSIGLEENEQNVEKLIAEYPMQIENITEMNTQSYDSGRSTLVKPALRILQHKHQMEGFFLVKLRKMEEQKIIVDYKKAKFDPTLTCEDRELQPELEHISQKWGIPFETWGDYRYLLTKSRIWLLDKHIEIIPGDGFNNAGLLMAERKFNSWKLFNQSVQLFKQYVSRKIEVDQKQLVELFSTGRLRWAGVNHNYYAVSFEGQPMASVYCYDNTLQIRLPHRYTLPEQEF